MLIGSATLVCNCAHTTKLTLSKVKSLKLLEILIMYIYDNYFPTVEIQIKNLCVVTY